ncbi:MAG: hypothetical protein VB108_01300 [Anaerolineaceae bacterium]|nr:hypothetical protein [Anaerolineaceae bacterium]
MTNKPNPLTLNPITGLVHITGEPDTGKTTLALSCGFKPEEIVFFDDDVKTQSIADMLKAQGTPFGVYENLTKASLGMREVEYHSLVMSKINALPVGKFKAFIFDTWTRFENTFNPTIQENPLKYRKYYSPNGTFKGVEMWKAAFDLEAAVIDQMTQVAPLVILITHLKDHAIGSAKTGKEVPDCKKPVIEKARFRIWTRHNSSSPAPIGLVLKRLSKVEVGPEGIRPINVLPRKINPCTWRRILEYWNDPIGDREPSADEMPNAFELSILDDALTADQKDALHINAIEADNAVEEKNAEARARIEAKKAAQAPTIGLSDLISSFGEEAVKEANGGKMPENESEIAKVTKALMG